MDIKMPCADAGLEKSTLARWLVKPGDQVEPGDTIALVVIPNGDSYELKIYERGWISRLLIPGGTMVSVGSVIASLAPEGNGIYTHPQVARIERYMSEPVVKSSLQKSRVVEQSGYNGSLPKQSR